MVIATRSSVVLFAASLVALAWIFPIAAQQPARGPLPRETRGAFKSIDAEKRVVTVTTIAPGQTPMERTFTLAKDVEVALGDGTPRRNGVLAGRLEDLAAGSTLTLSLTDDDQVTGILAQGPLVRGTLKSVDVPKKMLTVAALQAGRDQPASEPTYQLAAGVEIGIDDGRGRRFSVREGKLADLTAGAMVSLQLSPNQKEVQSVVAEAPTLTGIVKKVGTGDNTIAIVVGQGRPGDEPEARTLMVAADAAVLLDDGRGRLLSLTPGKLADIPTGSIVRLRLAGDQSQVMQITAEGPNVSGMVKAVDAANRTIKVAVFVARGQEPEEKTLPVAAEARVVVDNKPARLDDVKPTDNGPFGNLRLSLDQKTVLGITIVQNNR